MVEMMVTAVVVVMNCCFNYWLYRRFRHLGTANRYQAATIRRLSVNAIEASGKLISQISEWKVREEAAREQRDGFNRFLLKIVKDGLPNQAGHSGNGSRCKPDNSGMRNVKNQGNIVLHERPGF